MPRYKFIVMSSPIESGVEEFNRWYAARHLPDMLAVPGIVSAERGQIVAGMSEDGSAAPRYVATYEIQSDDIMATLTDLNSRADTDAMQMSETIDRTSITTFLYEIMPTAG